MNTAEKVCDVAVVGLGTMGSMALWQLSQEPDTSVIGIEQYGIGHAHGAFAGESRLFRAAAHEHAAYTPMLLRSRELWQQLEAESGQTLLLETGVLSVADQGAASLRNVRRSVEEHSLPHETLNAEELRSRYPQHKVAPTDIGILDTLGGALRCEAAVLSAVAQAQHHGADVVSGTPVTAVEVSEDGVAIQTGGTTIRAAKAVVTPGPWATSLRPALRQKMFVKPTSLMWFLPQDHAKFTPEVFPAFIRDRGDIHLFGAPSVDGYTVKVVPTRLPAPVERVEDMDRGLSPEVLSLAGRQVNELIEGLSPEPVRYSVHPEGQTANKVPIIDRSEDGRAVTLAAFSGHGFKFAPVIGEIARTLIRGDDVGYTDPGFALDVHPDI